uniref:GH10 domain-containing protein n=1 Tax=Leersia perrieri TaxID=77586 RepID=A0A0D9XIU4_9ORYZ
MVQSVPYDHTASIECLGNPMTPLYNGGVIKNSEFNNGLKDWTVPWGVEATVSTSLSGNKFAEAQTSNGQLPSRTVYQTVQMEANTHYSLSAWLKVSAGTANVRAVVKTADGQFVAAGATVAKEGCWSMIKGGMTAYSSGPGQLYFEADAVVVIWVDSVSLQPFSFAEWDSHRQQPVSKARRSTVKVVARGADGTPMANATVGVNLLRPGFPFGNAMTREILDIPAYQQWFTSRFTVATFENEMKWYSTEWSQNHEDYTVPDAMLNFAEQHNIKVRGHNVVWDDNSTQMGWVKSLGVDELKAAIDNRIRSFVSRYRKRVIGWDVVNENLHWNFFESKLGPDASSKIYERVGQIDGDTPLFMNEFNTVEQPLDTAVMATKYVSKLKDIRSFPGNVGLNFAIGLESHFGIPNIPFMRATLDTLAQLELPIWLTEIDVTNGPNQAQHLEQVLREGYGHPSVDGMVMWAAWHAHGCYVMCLTDNNFRNLAVGDVVDKLIAEWRTHPVAATTDADGVVELDLVHGEYNVTVTHPSIGSSAAVRVLTVDSSSSENGICLRDPMKPLYNGGIIQNGEFNSGLMGWSTHRNIKAGVSSSPSGNKFAVVQRAASVSGAGDTVPVPSRSVFQKISLQRDTHYSLSAWLQVPTGTAHVKAFVRTHTGEHVVAGSVAAQSGCWNMLKGGMTTYSSGPGEIFFESDAPVDIWVDSVALQPFTFEEWDAHRQQSASKARRSTVKVVARGPDGAPMSNATVIVELLRTGFPFGNTMTKEILDLPAYEKWFTSRFTVATFENEMKWYSTEWTQNNEDYRVPDAMLKLAQKYNIKVRGHNVFWNDQNSQMKWVKPLNLNQLKAAMQKRLKSVVTRYAGKVIHWDVVNENLHFNYFESKLGSNASPMIYNQVGSIDHNAILFMNEFNTLEQPGDPNPVPSKYIAKMKQIKGYTGNGGLKLGVGLESHFSTPNLPYMRSALDTLAQLKLPMWLTEVDVVKGPNQVKFLEQVLREGYAHPSINGMIMWAAWHAKGCYVMCLTDNNFKNLPVGNVVDKLIAEWKTHKTAVTTGADGAVELDLPHGEYNLKVSHPSLGTTTAVHAMTVDAASSASEHQINIKV